MSTGLSVSVPFLPFRPFCFNSKFSRGGHHKLVVSYTHSDTKTDTYTNIHIIATDNRCVISIMNPLSPSFRSDLLSVFPHVSRDNRPLEHTFSPGKVYFVAHWHLKNICSSVVFGSLHTVFPFFQLMCHPVTSQRSTLSHCFGTWNYDIVTGNRSMTQSPPPFILSAWSELCICSHPASFACLILQTLTGR